MIAAVIVCDAIVADPPAGPPYILNSHPCPAKTRAGMTPEVVTTLARRDGWSLDSGQYLCPQHAGAAR